MKLFSIPNLITLANLFCGCLAIVFAFNGNLVWAAYLVGIAAVLDFLDGFVARALKQYSPIGKDLDSLADMVTFGVVPGVVMFQLISWTVTKYIPQQEETWQHWLPYSAFLITLFSALRLAKFNNDTRQSDSFIGVPTPANSIFICSIPLILYHQAEMNNMAGELYNVERTGSWIFGVWTKWMEHWPLIFSILSVVMSFFLISEISLFALKFKSFKWKGNEIRYSFLAACLIMLVFLKFIALPLIIVLYILMSIVNNLLAKKPST